MELSIIIPSYNQGAFIGETLRSILNQSWTKINRDKLEVIVMDGGSKDNTLDVLKGFSGDLDIVVSRPDKGQADALHKGYELSKGEYIGWQNSDDLYLNNCFEEFFNQKEKDISCGSEYDVYFGNQLVIDEKSIPIYGKIFSEFDLNYLLLCGWNITNQSSFFKRTAIEKIGGFDPSLQYAMDFDFYVRLAKAQSTFKWINSYWGGFRIHKDSKGSTMKQTRIEEYALLRKKFIENYKESVPWENQFVTRKRILKTKRVLDMVTNGQFFKALNDKINKNKLYNQSEAYLKHCKPNIEE
jgi:glycosyltransferase involved in cell wall biosynthesis